MVPLSWWGIQEDKVPRPPVREYLRGVWALLRSNFFLSQIVFGLVYAGIGQVGSPASILVQRYWARVENLQKQAFRVISQVCQARSRIHQSGVRFWCMLLTVHGLGVCCSRPSGLMVAHRESTRAASPSPVGV